MSFLRTFNFSAKWFLRLIKYNKKDKYNILYLIPYKNIFIVIIPDVSECLLSKSNKHQNNLGEFSGKPDLPYFDKAASINVTSPLGKTAYLNCRVKNLANRTVSKRDVFNIFFILTVEIGYLLKNTKYRILLCFMLNFNLFLNDFYILNYMPS